MKYFFTSDFHLGHANIMKYCGRTQFMSKKDLDIYNNLAIDKQTRWKVSQESLNNMNKEIIRRCNERVKAEDLIFFLGDYCFKSGSHKGEGTLTKADYWKSQFICKNWIYIKGNHDKASNSLKTAIERLVIGYGGRRINLVHDPERADINYDINIVGHVHNNWKFKRIRKGESFTDCVNVGVDVWNFLPITFNEIMKEYHRWKNKQ